MNNLVAIERCHSYHIDEVTDAVENALAPLGGIEAFIRKGDRVLLKPNLLNPKPSSKAVTTHPSVVEAAARMSLDCGAEVKIGDSPPIFSAQRTAKSCGIAEVAQRLGIEIVNFTHPTTETRTNPVLTAGIQSPCIEKSLLETDVIINLPKLKSHCQMLLTCSVKNLYGCVLKRRKALWHFRLQKSTDDFAAMILANYEKISPELTIVDAVVGMEGMGPGKGIPIDIGLILAGQNAVAIDRVVTELVHATPIENYVLRMARRFGFEGTDLESIQISGLSLEEAKLESFLLPDMYPIGFSMTHLAKGMVKYFINKFRNRPKTAM